MASGRGSLDGIRVLDLIDGPGAYGPKLLVGFGADVIRVELPAGSIARRRRSPWRIAHQGGDPGTYFVHYNAGKRGITLDPVRPAGRHLLSRLLDRAAIVFDNGLLARAGFPIDQLIEREPPLVIVSVSPFGIEGPRSDWQGSDLIIQAMSGMIGYFGYRNERPARFGPAQAEEMSGLAAALGALIAWHGSHSSGRGEFVDIAMQRVCALTTFQMSNASLYHQFGFTRERSPRAAGLPSGLYQALDGYFAFNAWRDTDQTVAFLERFDSALPLRELYSSLGAEAFQHSEEGREAVASFVASRTRAELTEIIQGNGLMGLPVHDVKDLLADPFLRQRAFFVDVDVPGFLAPIADAGPPVRMSGTPFLAGRRPPLVGEHNVEVFGELGLGPAELASLSAEGIV